MDENPELEDDDKRLEVEELLNTTDDDVLEVFSSGKSFSH